MDNVSSIHEHLARLVSRAENVMVDHGGTVEGYRAHYGDYYVGEQVHEQHRQEYAKHFLRLEKYRDFMAAVYYQCDLRNLNSVT